LSESASGPADITTEQFHEVADQYLDALIEKLEALQEETEEVDVEYSVSAFSPFVLSLGGIELSVRLLNIKWS
jgi:frataxin